MQAPRAAEAPQAAAFPQAVRTILVQITIVAPPRLRTGCSQYATREAPQYHAIPRNTTQYDTFHTLGDC
jgi:broad specificity polyphosphatase/5'/3'-nucleotidase SurE